LEGGVVMSTCVEELYFTQDEAETRIIVPCLFDYQSSDQQQSIVIRSPDTDVFVLLLYYSEMINKDMYFDIGSGNERRMISINSIVRAVGEGVVKALPALHAFTGADCTSSFV
jgi:hypothetical protein